MRLTQLPIIFSGLSALLVAGCTDEPDTGDTDTLGAALELENGGLTTADEAPSFGEPEAFDAAAVEGDRLANDELANDAAVVALRERPDGFHARVAIMWGELPPDLTRDDRR